MRVALIHNHVPPDASKADRDVFLQIAAVSHALVSLGHEPVRIPGTLNLEELRSQLAWLRPDVVFNLVESLEGSDWLMFLATGLLDAMGIPYTGSPTEAILLSSHKVLAKQRLREAGLPTPAWFCGRPPECRQRLIASSGGAFQPGGKYLVKAVSQHASVGLDDDCVFAAATEESLYEHLERKAGQLECPCFAEAFIDGREFNLSLLARAGGVEVLPLAEIDFSTFPEDKPRIVGYRAKWEENSFEYLHTGRNFDFPATGGALLETLCGLASRCWDLFGLGGYGRVDFRIDGDGRPWILEVNANPCLSPDAGFAAALERASIPFEQAVQRILDDARDCRSLPTVREAPPPIVRRTSMAWSQLSPFGCGVPVLGITEGSSPSRSTVKYTSPRSP